MKTRCILKEWQASALASRPSSSRAEEAEPTGNRIDGPGFSVVEPNEESLALRGSRLELGELAAGENPIANTFASPIANSVAFEMVPESPDPYGAMFQRRKQTRPRWSCSRKLS